MKEYFILGVESKENFKFDERGCPLKSNFVFLQIKAYNLKEAFEIASRSSNKRYFYNFIKEDII